MILKHKHDATRLAKNTPRKRWLTQHRRCPGIGLKHNLNDIGMYYKLSHGCYLTGQKHTGKKVADTEQAVPRNWTEAQLE